MKKIISVILAVTCAAILLPMNVKADEWVKKGDGYVYKYDDGTTAEKGWLKLDGKTYYIQKDGTRKTGWLETSSGTKYYFGSDGVMYKSKWAKFKNGSKYYFDGKGIMVTGIKTILGETYYFDKDGKMKTGWIKSDGSWYYFRNDGKMAKDCSLKLDGVTYKIDKNGKSKTAPKTKEKLKEFEMPTLGTSKSKVLKECGITNYKKDSKENIYTGDVLYADIESKLKLSFDSKDKLSGFHVYIPANYADFYSFLKITKKSLGYDYINLSDLYIWDLGSTYVSLNYSGNNIVFSHYKSNY